MCALALSKVVHGIGLLTLQSEPLSSLLVPLPLCLFNLLSLSLQNCSCTDTAQLVILALFSILRECTRVCECVCVYVGSIGSISSLVFHGVCDGHCGGKKPHQFTKKDNVFPSHYNNALLNVSITVIHIDSLHGILEDQVGWHRAARASVCVCQLVHGCECKCVRVCECVRTSGCD